MRRVQLWIAIATMVGAAGCLGAPTENVGAGLDAAQKWPGFCSMVQSRTDDGVTSETNRGTNQWEIVRDASNPDAIQARLVGSRGESHSDDYDSVTVTRYHFEGDLKVLEEYDEGGDGDVDFRLRHEYEGGNEVRLTQEFGTEKMVTEYGYDAAGHQNAERVLNPDGSVGAAYTTDWVDGLAVKRTYDRGGDGTPDKITVNVYEGTRLVSSTTEDRTGDAPSSVTTIQYDADGRVTEETTLATDNQDVLRKRVVVYESLPDGRLETETIVSTPRPQEGVVTISAEDGVHRSRFDLADNLVEEERDMRADGTFETSIRYDYGCFAPASAN